MVQRPGEANVNPVPVSRFTSKPLPELPKLNFTSGEGMAMVKFLLIRTVNAFPFVDPRQELFAHFLLLTNCLINYKGTIFILIKLL